MTKKDLKDWMIVELRNGTRYIYCSQNDGFFVTFNVRVNLSNFDDNLKWKYTDRNFDVMKIYKNKNTFYLSNDIFKDENLELIWERDDIDWDKIEVDTPILVSDNGENWYHRYFAKYENGNIFTFVDGRTSWSVEDYKTNDLNPFLTWRYAKLIKEIEIDLK